MFSQVERRRRKPNRQNQAFVKRGGLDSGFLKILPWKPTSPAPDNGSVIFDEHSTNHIGIEGFFFIGTGAEEKGGRSLDRSVSIGDNLSVTKWAQHIYASGNASTRAQASCAAIV
jgi:hypothetical protein